jgi:hypothetical protein
LYIGSAAGFTNFINTTKLRRNPGSRVSASPYENMVISNVTATSFTVTLLWAPVHTTYTDFSYVCVG